MITIEQYHEFSASSFGENLYNIVPKNCRYCDYPIIITLSKRLMCCSNPSCPKHMSYKADIMLKDMGVKNIGAQTAFRLIQQNKLKCHMDILGLQIGDMPNNNNPEVRRKLFYELQKGRKQPLSKILRYYQLDDIAEQSSTKLLKGYNSFVEFFALHNSFQKVIEHFCRALNQSRTEALLKMAYHLYCSQEDLIRVQKYFDIVQTASKQIPICMTGEVLSVDGSIRRKRQAVLQITPLVEPSGNVVDDISPHLKKDDYVVDYMSFNPRQRFIDFLNRKYEGIVSFAIVAKATQGKYLLLDSTKGKQKTQDARSAGVDVLSFRDFVTKIEEQYGNGNEDFIIQKR